MQSQEKDTKEYIYFQKHVWETDRLIFFNDMNLQIIKINIFYKVVL